MLGDNFVLCSWLCTVRNVFSVYVGRKASCAPAPFIDSNEAIALRTLTRNICVWHVTNLQKDPADEVLQAAGRKSTAMSKPISLIWF